MLNIKGIKMNLSDSELLTQYPNYSLSDLHYYQTIGQLWSCKGNIMEDNKHKIGALPEQWRDYNRLHWPGYIGFI